MEEVGLFTVLGVRSTIFVAGVDMSLLLMVNNRATGSILPMT